MNVTCISIFSIISLTIDTDLIKDIGWSRGSDKSNNEIFYIRLLFEVRFIKFLELPQKNSNEGKTGSDSVQMYFCWLEI